MRRTRVQQPPIQPALRETEAHDFWPGFICALVGAVVLFCGARHMTEVATTTGGSAWETQLIQAFSQGGIEHVDVSKPPPPPPTFEPLPLPKPDEPASSATDRRHWQVRVNLGAKTPCPT